MTADAEHLIRKRLALGPVEGLTEISIHRAHSGTSLGRLVEGSGSGATPYWAFAWAGGAVLARHVLDHPETVAGRRVLDLGAGSGIVGIAAAKAGARSVMAAETNAFGAAAIRLNALSNGVVLTVCAEDVTRNDPPDVDMVLAGDVFYSRPVGRRMLGFLRRCRGCDIKVLVGDPGRTDFPGHLMRPIAHYDVVDMGSRRPEVQAAVYALD